MGPRSGAFEEFVWLALGKVVAAVAGREDASRPPSARELGRIAKVIRRIEADVAGAHGLEGLSAAAEMSRHHFLRVFRRVTGATPHQFLIHARMRQAARRLLNSRETVLSIALESGFGDLSNFNRRFREIFGVTPRSFRSRS